MDASNLVRQLPFSVEAEQALLGAIIYKPELFDSVGGIISADDFYLEEHKHIYTALCSMYMQSKTIDTVTLVNALVEQGDRDEAGGVQYISLIVSTVPSTANIKDYARIVKDKAILRKLIGVCDISSPSAVHIYASTFEAKDTIKDLIKGTRADSYNSGRPKEQQIDYTDYVQELMGGITIIIEAVSAVLISFVAISLVVSSVMIGIITNISVLERTKEIGILRAIGASKRDVSRVFNAETFIIGSASGILGIVTTVLLCFPINAIIRAVTGIPNISAYLPPVAAVILVLISMLLTMIAGLIPARNASKKDPVEALRSE